MRRCSFFVPATLNQLMTKCNKKSLTMWKRGGYLATSNLLICKSIRKLALKTIIGWRNKGKRIAVLHNGQALKRAGAGKLCELEGTTRAKMNNHMQSRRSKIGYVSMKIKYIEKQATMHVPFIYWGCKGKNQRNK